MSGKDVAALACAIFLSTLFACAENGAGGGAEQVPDAGDLPPREGMEAAPVQPRLQPGQLRYAVIVLPADTDVEVEGMPARRRDGVIELVGTPGQARRLRLFEGKRWLETDVTIEKGDNPPARLVLQDEQVQVVAGSAPRPRPRPPAGGPPPPVPGAKDPRPRPPAGAPPPPGSGAQDPRPPAPAVAPPPPGSGAQDPWPRPPAGAPPPPGSGAKDPRPRPPAGAPSPRYY